MKSYGVTGYRFSIACSRIIPLGGKDDPVNEAGVAFYNRLIDELIAHNMTPFATLFHWDTPQTLEDRCRRDKDIYMPDFVRYARVCFERFGDRVKNWITYNEPGVYTLAGYAAGVHAPGRSSYCDRNEEGDSSTEPFIVAHTELVSHGYVCDMYKKVPADAKGQDHDHTPRQLEPAVGQERPERRGGCTARTGIRDCLVRRPPLWQGRGRLPRFDAGPAR